MNIINNDLNNKYINGKIYKIVCNVTGKIYVGSTIKPLKIRLSGHQAHYNSYLNEKYHYVSSFDILKDGNYFIELICNADCTSKKELNAIEGVYIRDLECVNRFIPGRTKKEYNDEHADTIKEQHKKYYKSNVDRFKEYYKSNVDTIKEQHKKYYKSNVGTIKKQQKKYYNDNLDKLKEQKKIYQKENSDKLKQKIICLCGGKHSYSNISIHCKTKKHLNYLKIEL